MMLKKDWLRTGFFAALPALSAVLMARMLLRNLFLLLYFAPDFSGIFAQIQAAVLYTPVTLILFAWLLFWLLQRRKGKALSIFLWIDIFGVTLLLTRVNGIRFCDVLFSLLNVMEKGGL